MWTNKQSSDLSRTPPGTGVGTLTEPAPTPAPATAPANVHKSTMETPRVPGSASRAPAWLGPGLKIKGQISGTEDLQMECKVDGPISLGGHRLTIGQNARVNGEITASEVVVFGEVSGNLVASDRIEIKKHGSVVGDLKTSRIVIEDGAYFKGAIEVARKAQPNMDLDTLLARPEKKTL
jgi:cytoskeletal protein CcmA (bactofilin family)